MRRVGMIGVFGLLALPAIASNLRYAEDQAPAIVNPLFGSTMVEARVNELMFEGLYTDDQNLATVPQLAQAAEMSSDRLEMVITLRNDVKWQDGQRFEADDVVFTIKAMKDAGTASTEAGRVSWIKDVVALDANHVKLTFHRPEAQPEEKLLFKILPAHRFNSTTVKRTDTFRSDPIGTGPYSLVKYNQDNSISFSANPEHEPAAQIPEITLREVSDKNYQAKLLLYESLEALVRVLPRDLASLQNNRKVDLYPYQTNSWWYMGFNLSRAPFNDPNVRLALAHLIDTDALLAPVGTGELLSGPFVKSSPYYNHSVSAWSHNEDKAASYLTAAGYSRQGNSWVRNGTPLALKITAHQALESAQEVTINLQSQLQSAGIQVAVEFLDEAVWKSRIWNNRDFEVLLSQWSFDRNEDIREQFHSAGTRNFVSYQNPAVDQLLDQARDAVDPQVRKASLREVHQKIHDDLPVMVLWTLDSYAAMSAQVRDVVIHPFYFFTWVHQWSMK